MTHPPPSLIAVDLDGTLSRYDYPGQEFIGEPIPRMVARVKNWLAEGRQVVIHTARLSYGEPETSEVAFKTSARTAAKQKRLIQAWCREHLGVELPITNRKPYNAAEFWDDKAVAVISNDGRTLEEYRRDQEMQRPPRCLRGPVVLGRRF